MTDQVVSDEASVKKSQRFCKYKIAVLILIGLPLLLQVAVMIHNFRVYGARAQQHEAISNLEAIFALEKAYYEKRKRYGTFDEIGFKPGNLTRYTYRIDRSDSPGTIFAPSGKAIAITGLPYALAPDNTVMQAGISSDGQHFNATATSNLDRDSTIDQWHINEQGLSQKDVDDIPYGLDWVVALLTNSDNL